VSVCIIIILVAVAFPSFQRARETSKAMTCSSNLRQLATLFNVYAQEKGRYPQVYRIGSSGHWYYNEDFVALLNSSQPVYATQVKIWAGQEKLYLCPADDNGNKNISIDGNTRFLSYGANLMLGAGEADDPDNPSPNYNALSPVRVNFPSKLIMLCDAKNFYFNPADNGASAISLRHRGGLNVAFTDGHVEWRKEIDSDPSLLWPAGVPH